MSMSQLGFRELQCACKCRGGHVSSGCGLPEERAAQVHCGAICRQDAGVQGSVHHCCSLSAGAIVVLSCSASAAADFMLPVPVVAAASAALQFDNVHWCSIHSWSFRNETHCCQRWRRCCGPRPLSSRRCAQWWVMAARGGRQWASSVQCKLGMAAKQ